MDFCTILYRKTDGSYQNAFCLPDLQASSGLRDFLRKWITEHLPDGSVVLSAVINRLTSPDPDLILQRAEKNH